MARITNDERIRRQLSKSTVNVEATPEPIKDECCEGLTICESCDSTASE